MIHTPTGSVVSTLTPTCTVRARANSATRQAAAAASVAAAANISDTSSAADTVAHSALLQQMPPPVLRLSEMFPDGGSGSGLAAITATAAAAVLAQPVQPVQPVLPAQLYSAPSSAEVPVAMDALQQAGVIAGSAAAVLQFAPTADVGELGTPALPTRGSALHRWGACKPCAFTFKEGCMSGIDCQFCHLCGPGERRRRKKERLVSKRDCRVQTPRPR